MFCDLFPLDTALFVIMLHPDETHFNTFVMRFMTAYNFLEFDGLMLKSRLRRRQASAAGAIRLFSIRHSSGRVPQPNNDTRDNDEWQTRCNDG